VRGSPTRKEVASGRSVAVRAMRSIWSRDKRSVNCNLARSASRTALNSLCSITCRAMSMIRSRSPASGTSRASCSASQLAPCPSRTPAAKTTALIEGFAEPSQKPLMYPDSSSARGTILMSSTYSAPSM
jgi:hypothetical protein